MVGYNEDSIAESYSTSPVTREKGVGGLVGDDWAVGHTIASFWDTETSGQAGSASGTGLLTAEMQTAGTFLETGWDFVDEAENGTDDLWWILEGRGYPRLWWELGDEASP